MSNETQTTDLFGDKAIVRLMFLYLFIGTSIPTLAGTIYLSLKYAGGA